MPRKKCSDAEFIALFQSLGAAKTAARLEADIRNVYRRRRVLEERLGVTITTPDSRSNRVAPDHPEKIDIELDTGYIFIGSDSHYWPDEITAAHRAFIKLAKKLKPAVVIKNGDELDGATISRFPKSDWFTPPSLVHELECVRDRLCEITKVTPNARHIWCVGNHDMRYESRIANELPEYAKINGTRLRDHFPEWRHCILAEINDSVIVKHRFKGGIHARHNNTMWAGRTIVCGHLHRLGVSPFTDYNGTRYGIEVGTMADTWGDQFRYLEMNPRNWQSGFAILSFHEGQHIDTELVKVLDKDRVVFRGQVLSV